MLVVKVQIKRLNNIALKKLILPAEEQAAVVESCSPWS